MPREARENERIALLRELFDVAVRSVSAGTCVPPHLPEPAAGRTLILGVGKAGAAMARVAAEHLSGRLEGIVLTRYGHGYPPTEMPPGFMVLEAGHPLPDSHGVAAAQHVLEATRSLGESDQLLALVSGGGSALLALPAPGVTLADKQQVTRELLLCGAPTAEINCVRAHLSAIKGGRLATVAYPAKVITLVLSDVTGDDPSLVASGPTVACRTTLADARAILRRHGIHPPQPVRAALENPSNETPAANSPGLDRAVTRVVARSEDGLRAAGERAQAAGYTPVYLGSDIDGDATATAKFHGELARRYARKAGRWALLSGGETTVTVRNREGRGGRNSEYLLSLVLTLDSAADICALACDTDGIDGTQDNAGAVISPSTLHRARQLGLSATELLQRNLSYDFFAGLDDLVMTGPTRTNVNDFRAILIDAS